MYKLKIKSFRKLKRITQKQLADKIGISQNFLSEVENQKYDIRLSLLFKISQVIGVCPKELIECNCCKKENTRHKNSTPGNNIIK